MTNATKWEYRIESFGGAFKRFRDEEMEDILNQWGIEGWEVFAYYQVYGSNKVTVVAKRPAGARSGRREREEYTW